MKVFKKLIILLFIFITSQGMAQPGTWLPLGSGTNSTVYTLAADGDTIYAGGLFTRAGGNIVNRIAKWDGTSWSALGTGFNNSVFSLVVKNGVVYAAGQFTTAGGTPAFRIAKWDGTNWSPLGSGLNDLVSEIVFIGNDLYACGTFTEAGGNPANRVAKWDGTSWSALDSGLNNTVINLATDGVNLYAGGYFTQAGGIPANRIAKWDGANWSALGSGLNNITQSIAIAGNNLYVGGYFSEAGGVPVNFVAKWNGTSWSALGPGVNSIVISVITSGNDVYIGGNFQMSGADSIRRVAKWDGASWSPIGQGTSSAVYSLLHYNNNLYTGGAFTQAGDTAASRIAVFVYAPPAPINLTHSLPSPGAVQLDWSEFQSNEDGFVLQRRDLPDTNWVTIDTTGKNIHSYLDTGLTPGSYSYRLYAYNVSGNSGYSNTIPVNVLSPPNPPHSLSSSVLEVGVVFLSWTDSSSTENGFVVQRRDNINTNWVNTDTTITDSVTSIQTGLIVGRTYDWRVYAYNSGGNSGYSNIVSSMITGIENNSSIPDKYALYNNYPNPFNPTTKIKFDIPKSGVVRLAIYDILGRQVSTLVNNELSAGRYEMEWNAGSYSSGIYFYRIEADGFVEVKRMTLVK
ncbi:MAG: T9SS type A sorting domain-containing protein [Ignavibacteriae bacterium]|nr:T9SS type A sorting domain-containing protein [Ignavibacteriota bacterium]